MTAPCCNTGVILFGYARLFMSLQQKSLVGLQIHLKTGRLLVCNFRINFLFGAVIFSVLHGRLDGWQLRLG
jgi:hypothetical protein